MKESQAKRLMKKILAETDAYEYQFYQGVKNTEVAKIGEWYLLIKYTHRTALYDSFDSYNKDKNVNREFLKIKNYEVLPVKTYNNVYAEDMHRLIRETTGLNTNL